MNQTTTVVMFQTDNFLSSKLSEMESHVGIIIGIAAAATVGYYVLWGPSKKKRRQNGQIPGMLNLGNTCFLNAVLQGVAACPAFITWLGDAVNNKEKQESSHNLGNSFLHTLKVLNNQEPCDGDDMTPANVLKSLREHRWVISSEEQDAHEMYHVLLTTLQEELTEQSSVPSLADVGALNNEDTKTGVHKTASEEASTVSSGLPFKGLLTSQLMCRNCQHKYPVKYDTFDSLSLTIPSTLEDDGVSLRYCLQHFVKGELVSNVECEKCARASGGGDVRQTFFKKLTIGKLPQCLCIHLHRTIWLHNGMPMKCFDHVAYPEILYMDEFLHDHSFSAIQCTTKNLVGGNSTSAKSESQSSPQKYPTLPVSTAQPGNHRFKTEHKHRYQLQAVIVHLGDVFSGHFVTYRRGAIGTRHHNTWFFTSDTVVHETTLAKVMESPAYMLFYQKWPSQKASNTTLTTAVTERLDSIL